MTADDANIVTSGQESVSDAPLGQSEADVGHPEAPVETTAAADGSEFAVRRPPIAGSDEGAANDAPASEFGERELKTLYVGNLFFETTPESLRERFEAFGELVDVKVATDSRGLSRGFGFVEFANPDEAALAIDNLDQVMLDGRRMSVQFNKPKPRLSAMRPGAPTATPSKTLFIGNMSYDMTDKDLSELFSRLKNVLDVRLAVDRRTGTNRGFAHADFSDVESAKKAFEVLNGLDVKGRLIRVDYSRPSAVTRRF